MYAGRLLNIAPSSPSLRTPSRRSSRSSRREGGDFLRITPEGAAAAEEFAEPLPRGPELLQHWLGQMKRASERQVLLAVVGAWPNTIARDEVARAAGYEAAGGTFGGALSKLRSLELISGSSDLRASDALFE